jgi:hypothetical protein
MSLVFKQKMEGGRWNRPSWPAMALAGDMSLTGSLHAARNPCSPLRSLQAAQIREADNSTQVLLSVRTHPRVPRVGIPTKSTKIKNHPMKLGGFVFLVETAGIGHPGQPYRLQAICHSWARCMPLEFPTRPASRRFNSRRSSK